MGEFGTALQALSLPLLRSLLPLLSLLLLRPLPSPHPLRTEEKGANEGGREGKGSLRMKHDVDSCNFAMDIVMWEAHAKAIRTRSLLEGGEAGGERKMKSGNSFEAVAVDIFSHFGE